MANTHDALDNPVWHSLTTHHTAFSIGNDLARYYQQDVAYFGAMTINNEEGLNELAKLFEPGQFVALLGSPASLGEAWEQLMLIPSVQMVYEGPLLDAIEAGATVTPLSQADVPAMLQLVELTHPGPFLPRTIELGHYLAIWQEGTLVAIAGERMHLPGYCEISAVCTHPEFQRRGYARQLVLQLIYEIQQRGEIPFLNVSKEKTSVQALYEKLGFKKRAEFLGTY
jgi:GNAT superfamily N-acetyltransferase